MTTTPRDPSSVPVTFINRTVQLPVLSDAVARSVRVAVDTETHAGKILANGMWAALRVISVACRFDDGSYHAYVIDVRDIPADSLAPVMAAITVADAWNANFDSQVLAYHGCDVASWKDAMFTDGLLSAGSTGFEFWHGLAFAASKYLGVELAGKGTTQVSYDGVNDLTDEQIAYPAFDAVVTLWVAEHLDALVLQAGLETPVALEQAARPFILDMMRHGIPFDQQRWDAEVLSAHQVGKAEALAELARLTGGGDTMLFEATLVPSWNPDSDRSTREAFNTYAKDAVHEFKRGPLTAADKLDKTTLKQIKHPLAKALLKYREHAKVLSTYGDNLTKYIGEDGRIRSQYRQGGVVATGRLASEAPNAQNFSPEMKRFMTAGFREADDGTRIPRAFVYADLSQAELRVLAQVSDEERMRETFRKGGDFHARTAADMFQVDMDSLKTSDPKSYSDNRKKAKSVSFGIPYGLGAAALATNLTTNSGLKTTTEEAQVLLRTYGQAYPAVNQWLTARDRFVKDLAANPGDIDWVTSLELHRLWVTADPVRKSLKRKLGRHASFEEIATAAFPDSELQDRFVAEHDRGPSVDELAALRKQTADKLRWAFSFDAAVALRPDGTPWSFESRTLTGRRRLFTIPMDSTSTRGFKGKFEGILTHAMLIVCTSDNPQVAELRAAFAAEHGLNLPAGVRRNNSRDRNLAFKARIDERNRCIKEFEGDRKSLKYELLKFFTEHYITRKSDGNGGEIVITGEENVYKFLLPMAMNEQVRSLGNRYRNHPIQSLVADIGLQYYADLHAQLKKFSHAYPVQAVHDSIAIECDLAEAVELCTLVQGSLENALRSWCPDVPAKADADIRLTLDDDDVIEPEAVPAKLAELLTTAGV
jgi:DNA polymerase I-like protein with 3'-5' exonuclease and polymerase domains